MTHSSVYAAPLKRIVSIFQVIHHSDAGTTNTTRCRTRASCSPRAGRGFILRSAQSMHASRVRGPVARARAADQARSFASRNAVERVPALFMMSCASEGHAPSVTTVMFHSGQSVPTFISSAAVGVGASPMSGPIGPYTYIHVALTPTCSHPTPGGGLESDITPERA